VGFHGKPSHLSPVGIPGLECGLGHLSPVGISGLECGLGENYGYVKGWPVG
jgi:hypothetical protein